MRDLVDELNYLPIARRMPTYRGALPQTREETYQRHRSGDTPVFDRTSFAAHSVDEPRTALGVNRRW